MSVRWKNNPKNLSEHAPFIREFRVVGTGFNKIHKKNFMN